MSRLKKIVSKVFSEVKQPFYAKEKAGKLMGANELVRIEKEVAA